MAGVAIVGPFSPGDSYSFRSDTTGEDVLGRTHRRRDPAGPQCYLCGRRIEPGDVYSRCFGTETGACHCHETCVGAGLYLFSLYRAGCEPLDGWGSEMLQEGAGEGLISWSDEDRHWHRTERTEWL